MQSSVQTPSVTEAIIAEPADALSMLARMDDDCTAINKSADIPGWIKAERCSSDKVPTNRPPSRPVAEGHPRCKVQQRNRGHQIAISSRYP